MAIGAEVEAVLGGKFNSLFPHLDERQRRLAMGAEARSLGHGGIKAVARAAGASPTTVARGVAELEAGGDPLDRVRLPGAGRKPQTVKDPGLVAALLSLVEPGERGDPMSPLRWTTKSLRTLAAELGTGGHPVSAWTVANLLHGQGFSLQANSKQVEGAAHPDRDGQFAYLNDQSVQHLAAGQPVISVDTKKKELVGLYKNDGQQWRPAGDPVRVNVHDFPDPDLGKANPYGIYDVAPTTAGSRSAPTTTRPRSPWKRSAAGTPRSARPPTRTPNGCWCAPMAADPMAIGCAHGRAKSPPWPLKPG